jgi:hypothetical protein
MQGLEPAEFIRRWWGPEGFTCQMAKLDFREVVGDLSACGRQRSSATAICTSNENPELEFEPTRQVQVIGRSAARQSPRKAPRLTLRKLADESSVLLNRSSSASAHDWIVNLCSGAGFEPRVAKLADSPERFGARGRRVGRGAHS